MPSRQKKHLADLLSRNQGFYTEEKTGETTKSKTQ